MGKEQLIMTSGPGVSHGIVLVSSGCGLWGHSMFMSLELKHN